MKKSDREVIVKKSDTQQLDRIKLFEAHVKKSDTATIDLRKSGETKMLICDEPNLLE